MEKSYIHRKGVRLKAPFGGAPFDGFDGLTAGRLRTHASLETSALVT